MDDVARFSPRERAELFQETAARKGISAPVLIEKDFWVCWTLKRLFALSGDWPALMFKGGTSLSKVFDAIQRFSENIDLSLDRHGLGFTDDRDPANARSQKAANRLLKELEYECQRCIETLLLPTLREDFASVLEIDVGAGHWNLATDDDDPLTLKFAYPSSLLDGEYASLSYVTPAVRLEFGARSDHWPSGRYSVTPYAAEEFPGQFVTPSCEVTALEAERTFWEKATLLHAEYHRTVVRQSAERLSRHYYDLAMLARSPVRGKALAKIDLLEHVACHKDRFFRAASAQYGLARPGTLRLVPRADLAEALQADYGKMREMIFHDPPSFDELMEDLSGLEAEINALAQ